MKNETEVKLTLERKIVEMIDELKWLENHGGDPSSVVSLAILQLYSESKDDVEKAIDYSIDQHLAKEQIKKYEEETEGGTVTYVDDTRYFDSKLVQEELDQVISELDSGDSISRTAVQHYGEGYLGLIWNFHNRMLPVKFILHAIASDIVKNKKLPSLETARTIAGRQGYLFADKIYRDGDYGKFRLDGQDDRIYRILTGFPKTADAMVEAPKIKKYSGRGKPKATYDRKLKEAVQESQDFFVDKFLGNELKISKKKQDEIDFYEKNKKLRKVSGACFEMGLVQVDGDSRLSFTELGREFLRNENPILTGLVGQIRSGLLKMSGKVLSEDEVKFIIKKIIKPRFDLEYIMVKKILENSDTLSVTRIMLMLKNEQQDYIENNRIEKRSDEHDKGNLIKYRQQRATSTAMRLVEMGLLERQDEPKDDKKIAEFDAEYENALKLEIEERIESGEATEDEVKMFMDSKDAKSMIPEIAKRLRDKTATPSTLLYQKRLKEWLEKTKEKSELGRPKAFYRRTEFGKEIYEKILSKN